MYRLAFLLFVIVLISMTGSDILYNKKTVKILEHSQINILGSTNVNSFTCELNVSEINSVVNVYYNKNQRKILFDNTALHIDVGCFDCGSRLMNSDFKELLKKDIYPEIVLELKEIAMSPKNNNDVLAYMAIYLAGETRLYSFPLKVENEDQMHIYGCLSLTLSDFNLDAPTKALGLIVVSDQIEINIDLLVNPLE